MRYTYKIKLKLNDLVVLVAIETARQDFQWDVFIVIKMWYYDYGCGNNSEYHNRIELGICRQWSD